MRVDTNQRRSDMDFEWAGKEGAKVHAFVPGDSRSVCGRTDRGTEIWPEATEEDFLCLVCIGEVKLRKSGVLRPGRPKDLPKHCDHGTRSRYVNGCRCDKCTESNRLYSRRREKAKREGDWNGLVSAEPAREHILRLSKFGVGYKSVASASGVAKSVMADVRSGKKKRIWQRTLTKILKVDSTAMAGAGCVPAGNTWELINELLNSGYTKVEISRRLGNKSPALQLKGDRILLRTAKKVKALHTKMMEEIKQGPWCDKCKRKHLKDRLAAAKRELPCSTNHLLATLPCFYYGLAAAKRVKMDMEDLGAEGDGGIWRCTKVIDGPTKKPYKPRELNLAPFE